MWFVDFQIGGIFWRRDTEHNDTQHNDTQHDGIICDIQHDDIYQNPTHHNNINQNHTQHNGIYQNDRH
jgi:hypothetical protein